MMLHVRTFVRRFEVAESAHELLVLEVYVVEVEGEVPLGEGLEVAQAARNHLGQVGTLESRSTGLSIFRSSFQLSFRSVS